jgi:hypothetical protein
MLRAISRTRMFTPGFKLFSGIAVFALLMAFFVALGTNGTEITAEPIAAVLGPLTLGWKGFVGNHFGYLFFVGLAVASAFLAGLLVAFRDADPEAQAQVAHTDSVPLTRAPVGVNYWPLIGAVGGVLVAAGIATNRWLTYAGLGLLAASALVWTLRAWSERATGDDQVNAAIYHRFVDPLRVPVLSAVIVGLFALAISRLMLIVSKEAAVAVFGVTALVFFGVLAVIALYPKQTKGIVNVVAVVAVLFAVVCFVLYGIYGERDYEQHGGTTTGAVQGGAGTGAGGASGGQSEGGLAPLGAGPVSDGANASA